VIRYHFLNKKIKIINSLEIHS